MLRKKGMAAGLCLLLVLGGCSHGENSVSESVSASSVESTSVVPTAKKFKCSFVNYDQNVLYSTMVEEGKDAQYVGDVPSRPWDGHLLYTFTGWDKPLVSIKEDTVFTAQYSSAKVNYLVSFYAAEDKTPAHLLHQFYVPDGQKASYTWDSPIKDSTRQYSYEFDHWYPSLEAEIYQDTDFVAVYKETVKTFTVSYYLTAESTQPLYTESVPYGGYSSYTQTPTRDVSGDTAYCFEGWDKDPATSAITRDTAFYGTWSEYTDGLAFQLANDNASYVLSDGSKVTAKTVTIPSVHQGKPVTAIGAKAFQGNTALSAIGWPDTITEIGDSAFAGVNGLTELTLPPSVMTLGKSCFYGCLFLRSVDFSLAEQLTVIPSDCFRKTSLSWDTLKLPLNLAEIDEGAFGEDTKLISFEIPASVTSVMGGFLIGSPIATLTVADANTAYLAVDNVLFSLDKRNLVYYGKMIKATSYTLPSQVTAVLDEAFFGNDSLVSPKQDDNPRLAYLGKGCFGKMTSLRSFDFSKSAVTEIPETCFQGDSMLLMIYQAPGLLAIGKDAFSGCSQFTNLFLPETAQTFGVNAFKGCAALTLYLQAASEPDSLAAANPDSCPVRLACLSGTETGLSYSFCFQRECLLSGRLYGQSDGRGHSRLLR